MSNSSNDNFDSYDFFDQPYRSDARNNRDALDSRSGSGESRSRSGSSGRSGSGESRSRSGSSGRSGSGESRSRSGSSSRSGSGVSRSENGASRKPRTENRVETSRSRSYRPIEDEDKLPISVFIGIGVTVLAIILLVVSVIANSNRAKHKHAGAADDMLSDSDIVSTEIIDEPEDIDAEDDPVSSQIAFKSFIGTWYKEEVHESDKAILTVTMQYQDSFEFRLEIWNGSQSAVISDTAFYDTKKTTDNVTVAEYSPKKKTALTFSHDGTAIVISHTGKNSVFGISDKFVIDGRFTEEEPKYIVDEPETVYDYHLYQSDKIVNALKDTLSTEDYALYQNMISNGLKSPIEYERTTDKNGEFVNVDPELNAVKYYAYLPDQAMDMIFICTDDAKIYLLFYNSEQIIYCTNDSNYASRMPDAFQAVAKAKGITPTYR